MNNALSEDQMRREAECSWGQLLGLIGLRLGFGVIGGRHLEEMTGSRLFNQGIV